MATVRRGPARRALPLRGFLRGTRSGHFAVRGRNGDRPLDRPSRPEAHRLWRGWSPSPLRHVADRTRLSSAGRRECAHGDIVSAHAQRRPRHGREAPGAYQGLGAWIDRYDSAAWAQPEIDGSCPRPARRTDPLPPDRQRHLPTALPPRERLGRFIDAAHRRRPEDRRVVCPRSLSSRAATCIGRWRRSASGPLAAIASTPSRWISSRPAHVPSSAATGFCCGFRAAFARPSGAAIRSRRSSRRRAEWSFAPGAIGRTFPSPACTATTTSSS